MLLYLEDKTVSEVNYEPQVQISDSLIMEQTPGIWEEGCGQAILLQSHNWSQRLRSNQPIHLNQYTSR